MATLAAEDQNYELTNPTYTLSFLSLKQTSKTNQLSFVWIAAMKSAMKNLNLKIP